MGDLLQIFQFLATDLLHKQGVVAVIGIIVFAVTLRYSRALFQWIEDQTYGLRDYILQKCELLFIEIEPVKVTYILLAGTFGVGILTFCLFALGGNFLAGIIMGSILAFIGWKIPKPLMEYLIAKRIEEYQKQMVDGMNLLANGIRAGLSLPQAVSMVVDELSPPISQEFNLILQQNKIGVPLDECFESLNKRMPTEDNQMFVTSISVLRETGGNLAETFDTIVEVIRERVRLNQKIQTYVAQGKMQGGTIMAMPYLLALFYQISDPGSLNALFTTPLGIILLIAAIGLNLTGGYFILKVIRIKV